MVTSIQNVISSAITQNTALSSASGAASTSGSTSSAAPVSNVALVQSVSDNVVEASGLYSAAIELAGLSTRVSGAQSGTQQVTSILTQLSSIAQQVANGGEGQGGSVLDAEFQSLYSQISQIVSNTTFDGASLLNGSFSVDNSTFGSQDTGATTIPSLTPQSMFGNTPPGVSTPADANNALAAITNAQNVVNTANTSLSALDNQINFALASVATAQFNSEAATSVISEGEVPSMGGFMSMLLKNSTDSANTQGSKISSDTLGLIGE